MCLSPQIAECQSECGNVEGCVNTDTIDLWVTQTSCPVMCEYVSDTILQQAEEGVILIFARMLHMT